MAFTIEFYYNGSLSQVEMQCLKKHEISFQRMLEIPCGVLRNVEWFARDYGSAANRCRYIELRIRRDGYLLLEFQDNVLVSIGQDWINEQACKISPRWPPSQKYIDEDQRRIG